MAAPEVAVLDVAGKAGRKVTLEERIWASDIKPHLVHEAVRAELNAKRAGTRGAKSRGLVAGGRTKPWRQKGTGRARAGTTRAPQWTGGGVAFPPGMRSFEVKVNRKAARAALRSALTSHSQAGSFAVVDGAEFEQPSTRRAVELLAAWGKDLPTVLVAAETEEALIKSFRNVPGVAVLVPSELELATLVWGRSLLVSEAALPALQGRAT